MDAHQPIIAGIDGGGSRTRVVLVDARGNVLGAGQAGPANYHSVGLAMTQRNLTEAFKAAWKEVGKVAGEQSGRNGDAGASPRFCDHAFLGLAGVASEDDRARMIELALKIGIAPQDRLRIDHDMRIALAGAMPQQLATTGGIVLIAGTGSVAFGQAPAEKRGQELLLEEAKDSERNRKKDPDPFIGFRAARAGGMGHGFDDAGSGYDIGRRAISAAIRAADGRGQATVLTEMVPQAFGADLRHIVTGLSPIAPKRDNIAALAPHVIEAAQQHDAVADRILRAAANELVICVAAVAKQLAFESPRTSTASTTNTTNTASATNTNTIANNNASIPSANFDSSPNSIPVAITGGLAESGEFFLSYIRRAAAPLLPNIEWVEPAMEPVLGAAWLALQQAGSANDQTLATLRRATPSHVIR